MKKIVIFGTGDFSDVISYILEEKLQREIAAYTVNACYLTSPVYRDRPLVPFEEMQSRYPCEEYDVALGFIGKQMFRQRAAVFGQIREMGYRLANVIDPSARVDTPKIGEGNIVLANVSIENHCEIGEGNIIWQNVVLPHHNVIGSFNNLAPSVSLSGYSRIGSHCFVGNNVCIKNRVLVEDYAYVGAGAYVSKNVQTGTVLVPNRSYVLPDKTGFDFL